MVACIASTTLAQTGASLIENRGQWPKSVTHRAEIQGATVWIEPGAVLVDRYDQAAMQAVAHAHVNPDTTPPSHIQHHAFRLRFLGANKEPRIEPIGVRRGAYNYFIGDDPNRWGSNCHAFSAVVQHDIYPGVDLRIRTGGSGVKYDLLLAPGADLNTVRFQYDGAELASVTHDRLTLGSVLGEMSETIPIAYQEVDGEKRTVPCIYKHHGGTIGFEVGYFDAKPAT